MTRLIGKKVWIKKNVDSWMAGEWGIIKGFGGENYYIAHADNPDMELIFVRSEFTIHRKDNAAH